MKFENILKDFIRPIGKWQWIAFIVINVSGIGYLYLFAQFASLLPDHHCRVPSLEAAGWLETDIASVAIPQVTLGNTTRYSQCRQYNISGLLDEAVKVYDRNLSEISLNQMAAVKTRLDLQIIPCQKGWWYDEEHKVFQHSFSQEFNMVCEHYYTIPLATSIYFVGALIGRATGGLLADQFGRKPVLFIACSLAFVVDILVGLSPTLWMLIVLRILIGMLNNIAFVASVVVWSETTNDHYRNMFGMLFGVYDSFVVPISFVLFAYLIQGWRILHMSMVAHYGLAVLQLCLVAESPRWLLTKGKTEEAWAVIVKAIRWNRGRDTFTEIELNKLKRQIEVEYDADTTPPRKHSTLNKLSVIFSTPLRTTTLAFVVIFFMSKMGHLGFQLYSVRLKQTNPYLVASVGCVVALPGMLVKLVLYNMFDRKRPLVGVFLVCTTSCFAQAVLPWMGVQGFVEAALATLSLGCIFVAENMAITFITECYPTECRNFGVGVCACFGSAGAMLATFIERLDRWVWAPLPMIVFGVVSVSAAVATLFIPQTDRGGLQDRLDTPSQSGEEPKKYGTIEMEERTSQE